MALVSPGLRLGLSALRGNMGSVRSLNVSAVAMLISCAAGHPRTEANTYMFMDKATKPRPMCRPCRARNARKRRIYQIEAPRDRVAYRMANRERHNKISHAWYLANKKRCSAVKRILRISNKLDPSEGEIAQAWELRQKYPKREVKR